MGNTMQAHSEVMRRIQRAIERHEDLLPLLAAERDHLQNSALCRANVARFVLQAFESTPELDRTLVELEELGQLREPLRYPQFDLSFLSPPSPATTSSRELWNTSGVMLASGVRRNVRRLAEVSLRVRVDERSMNASFADLSERLSQSMVASPLAPRQGRAHGTGQTLALPDPQEDLEILVSVQGESQGRSNVRIEVRSLADAAAPLPAEVQLQFTGGRETKRTRRNSVNFVELTPGRYTLNVTPQREGSAGQVWQFDVVLEAN